MYKRQILHIAKCLKILVNLDFSKSLNHASSLEIAAIEASMLKENENLESFKKIANEKTINTPKNIPSETPTKMSNQIDEMVEPNLQDPEGNDQNDPGTDTKNQKSIEATSEQKPQITNENIIKTESWQLIIEKFAKIKGERFAIGALLRDCREASIDNDKLCLSFASNSNQERFIGELDHGRIKLDLIESISKTFQIPSLNEIVYNDTEKKSNSNNNSMNLSVMKALNWGGQIIEDEVQNDE